MHVQPFIWWQLIHRMVTEPWTLFERTCDQVGPFQMPQILRQLKSVYDPCSCFWTFQSCENRANGGGPEEVEQRADVGVSGSGFIETARMTTLVLQPMMEVMPTCWPFPQRQNVQWMHSSVVCTQRRPYCAPSVISARRIRGFSSRDMRWSTSRIFFIVWVMS